MPQFAEPIPGAEDLFQHLLKVTEFLGKPLPALIGIDGRVGVGKSILAAWLSWQMVIPVVSLELFVVGDAEPLGWRYQDLGRLILSRLKTGRPLIVEGICLCQVLQALDHDPDFLIWLENEGGQEHGPEEPTQEYEREFDPVRNADYRLTWRQPQPQAPEEAASS